MTKKIFYILITFLILNFSNSLADKIKIGTEGYYPPWNTKDVNGNLTGFEVELAYELCHIMKHDCEIVEQDWDGMVPALIQRKFDAIMAGMSITSERQKIINFSQGYADEVASFAINSNQFINTLDSINFNNKLNNDEKKSISILKDFLKGKTICVQQATIHHNFLDSGVFGKLKIKKYKSYDEVPLNLSKGKCQVGLGPAIVFLDYSEKKNKNINLIGPKFSGGPFGRGVGVGIRKGGEGAIGKRDKKLLKQFNKAIKIANKRGIIQRLSIKWFGYNSSMEGLDYIANLKQTPQIQNKILEITKDEKKIAQKKEKKAKSSETKIVKKPEDTFKPDATVTDKIKPKIIINDELVSDNPEFVLKGSVIDKGGSKNVYLFIQTANEKRQRVNLNNGKFEISRFSLDDQEYTLTAIDGSNNKFSKKINVQIELKTDQNLANQYDELRPLKIIEENPKRVALIIGIENYETTKVKALYANKDAKLFSYFANKSLGIVEPNIKLLIDDEATRLNAILAIKRWLPKKIVSNETELFVFFSGHGYPSKEGAYIIPHNGDPRILEESALSQKYIIDQIMKFKPKSITMFFDACYSGQSNTGEALVAGLKPLKIIAEEGSIPNNVNIFSSSKIDQTSSTIKEAKHGIFSYYLMKGLQGEADQNKNQQITNYELSEYLKKYVGEEALKQNHDQEPMLNTQKPNQVIMKF